MSIFEELQVAATWFTWWKGQQFQQKNLQSLMIEESRDIWYMVVCEDHREIYGCMYVYRYAVFVFLDLGTLGLGWRFLRPSSKEKA